MALAGILELDWDEANQPRHLKIELLTEDGVAVKVPTPMGDLPVQIETHVEVGRPVGTRPGTAFSIPIAINLSPLPIPPDGRYVWKFSIDGVSHEYWRLPFSTRRAEPTAPPSSEPG
jgi:hypothetical protein